MSRSRPRVALLEPVDVGTERIDDARRLVTENDRHGGREMPSARLRSEWHTPQCESLVQTGVAAARNGGTTVCVGAAPMDDAIHIAPAALFTLTEKKLIGCALGSCG